MPPRFFLLFVVPIALLPGVRARGDQSTKPEDFVFVQKGTLPIIVSAPHGGRKKVPDVPERLGKGVANFQTVLDANTDALAQTFAAELEKLLHRKPMLDVARFDR